MEIRQPVLKGDHLSLLGLNLTTLAAEHGQQYGSAACQLDLSYNQLQTVDNLHLFPNLHSLVLDNNTLESDPHFPTNLHLQTLWVNNNNISDLKVFMDCVLKAFPNLTYLSMMKNPACPNFFTGGDSDDYQRYRFYVLYRLTHLKFLDASPVTEKERKEAARVGPYMITAKPDTNSAPRSQQQSSLTDAIAPLPEDLQAEGKGPARFGMTTYVYYGKHSEGNRFILNEDL